MQLAMVGLGRMGANLVRRLLRAGHSCVVYDANLSAVEALASEGAVPAQDLGALVALMDAPRAVWVMLPHGETTEARSPNCNAICNRATSSSMAATATSHDDARRAQALAQHGIDYLDIGTSGGVWGLERGYCLMIGGPAGGGATAGADLRCARARRRHAGAHRASQRAARQRASAAGCIAAPPARATS